MATVMVALNCSIATSAITAMNPLRDAVDRPKSVPSESDRMRRARPRLFYLLPCARERE